jgi:hypothetical protein
MTRITIHDQGGAPMSALFFPRRPVRLALLILLVLIVATVEALLGGQLAHALKAAGVNGGTAITGVETFIDKLKANLTWLAVTVVGAAVIVIGLLFAMGHSRAQDIAIKGLIGAAIIAGGSGIVA